MPNPSALWARVHFIVLLAGALVLSRPGEGAAQALDAREAYFRTVGDHFRVPLREVAILSDWDLEPQEIPVVLFVASRAGVSPDVVVGLRKGGRLWIDVARRFGVEGGAFHVALPEGAPLGGLAETLGHLRRQPLRHWRDLRLTDADLTALVNLRVLSDQLDVELDHVLRAWDETGDFVKCHQHIRGSLVTQRLPYLD